MAETTLKIETIEGESGRKGLEGEIEVDAYNFGASNAVAVEGDGLSAGEVMVGEFVIQKKTDKSSPALFQACCSGKHIGNAVIKLFKSGGDEALNYMTITLEEAFVSSISWAGSTGIGSESVSLAFKKAIVDYKPQAKDGIGSGSVMASWNVVSKSKE